MAFVKTLSLKSLSRQIAYACLYLIGITIFIVIIHEAGHTIAALVLGVPFTELKFGFDGISPFVITPDWFAGAPLTIQHYAGGFTAAIILLLMCFLIIEPKNLSISNRITNLE